MKIESMKCPRAKYIVYMFCRLQLVVILTSTITLHVQYKVILLNTKNASIIQSNPYQLVMNWTCTSCKVLCRRSTVSFHIFTIIYIQHISVYYPTQWMLYSHVHSCPQSFTSAIIHTYTLVARPFTCGTVCFPLFLKVIEKGEGIIRALQVAVGHHIQTWKYTIVIPLYLIFHCIADMHSGVFRCWN